jgi:type IV pilus assembly protein PilP
VTRRLSERMRKMDFPRLESKLLSVSIVALFLLLGCSEGTAPVSLPKKASLPAADAKKTAAAKAEEKKEPEKEEVYSYSPAGKPDPFKPFLQLTPYREPRSAPLTPLQKYETSQLKLVAVLFTPEGNIGLVEDATGKGYFVKKGTLVGKNDGKVTKILNDRVIVEEIFLDVLGQKKVNEIALLLQKAEEGGEK